MSQTLALVPPQYQAQPRLVAPGQVYPGGITLYLTTPAGQYSAYQYLWFPDVNSARNFIQVVPQCLQTNIPLENFQPGMTVTVSRGYGCYAPQPPRPYCPCANN